MTRARLLVVEDEELMRSILRQLLESEGFEVVTADSAENALQIFAERAFDVVLSDIKMAGMDGIELLDRIKSIDEKALVIIMTAYSSVDTAVAALRKGAYDYVTKPFVNDDLLQTIRNATTQRELFLQNRALRRELNRHLNFSEIIGRSSAMQTVFGLIEKVAESQSNVLITGESGTGKELVAKAIHFNSDRSAKPFLAVNCGAMTESLLESELFGHVRGSFTGAVSDRKGLFRSAEGGTVFLDEISEMPITSQVRLLRALQEHEVTPIGTSTAVKFDARIIAATNRDLEAAVASGTFREDLFYRLNVIEINMPPLRERLEDIPLLANYFSMSCARTQNLPEKSISSAAMNALCEHTWPGNVRELENTIERAFVLSGDAIEVTDLPVRIANTSLGASSAAGETLDKVERSHILKTLDKFEGDKVQAASSLGIDLSTLYRKLKRYDDP